MRVRYFAVVLTSLLTATLAPGTGVASAAADAAPTPGALRACESGATVAGPEDNPSLVADCAALLEAESVLAGDAVLNWDAGIPIAEWEGVTLGGPSAGESIRVWKLELPSRGLSGGIAPQLGALAGLRELRLDGNELTGPIPPELGDLGHLFYLRLDRNRLTGSIPAELGQLGNLWSLQLDGNELTGPIPPELGNLGRLWYPWLRGNELTGEIPAELGDLLRLQVLRLAGNSLTGCVSTALWNADDTDLESLGLVPCDE